MEFSIEKLKNIGKKARLRQYFLSKIKQENNSVRVIVSRTRFTMSGFYKNYI